MGQAASDAFNEAYRARTELNNTTASIDSNPTPEAPESINLSPSKGPETPTKPKISMASPQGSRSIPGIKPRPDFTKRPSWTKKEVKKGGNTDKEDAVSMFSRSADTIPRIEHTLQERERKRQEKKAAKRAARKEREELKVVLSR